MRPLLLAVALTACGGGPAPGSGMVASRSSPTIAPLECMVRCENLKPQLFRDFGFIDVNCGTKEVLEALSHDACNCVFERQFGVRIIGDFAEPLTDATLCNSRPPQR